MQKSFSSYSPALVTVLLWLMRSMSIGWGEYIASSKVLRNEEYNYRIQLQNGISGWNFSGSHVIQEKKD